MAEGITLTTSGINLKNGRVSIATIRIFVLASSYLQSRLIVTAMGMCQYIEEMVFKSDYLIKMLLRLQSH